MAHDNPAASSTPSSRIPDFATRQEETEFWDTHDVTDVLDELRPANVRFADDLAHVLRVRLDPAEWRPLVELATAAGVAPTDLVRSWIKERLHEEVPARDPNPDAASADR